MAEGFQSAQRCRLHVTTERPGGNAREIGSHAWGVDAALAYILTCFVRCLMVCEWWT